MSYVFMLLGVVARAIVPWLIKMYRQEEWISWEWKALRSQLVGVVLVLVLLPSLMDNLNDIMNWDWQKAWLAGYAISDLSMLVESGGGRVVGGVKKFLNGG